jgi:hypothetical protein
MVLGDFPDAVHHPSQLVVAELSVSTTGISSSGQFPLKKIVRPSPVSFFLPIFRHFDQTIPPGPPHLLSEYEQSGDKHKNHQPSDRESIPPHDRLYRAILSQIKRFSEPDENQRTY